LGQGARVTRFFSFTSGGQRGLLLEGRRGVRCPFLLLLPLGLGLGHEFDLAAAERFFLFFSLLDGSESVWIFFQKKKIDKNPIKKK
jgi:hypothetical protein